MSKRRNKSEFPNSDSLLSLSSSWADVVREALEDKDNVGHAINGDWDERYERTEWAPVTGSFERFLVRIVIWYMLFLCATGIAIAFGLLIWNPLPTRTSTVTMAPSDCIVWDTSRTTLNFTPLIDLGVTQFNTITLPQRDWQLVPVSVSNTRAREEVERVATLHCLVFPSSLGNFNRSLVIISLVLCILYAFIFFVLWATQRLAVYYTAMFWLALVTLSSFVYLLYVANWAPLRTPHLIVAPIQQNREQPDGPLPTDVLASFGIEYGEVLTFENGPRVTITPVFLSNDEFNKVVKELTQDKTAVVPCVRF